MCARMFFLALCIALLPSLTTPASTYGDEKQPTGDEILALVGAPIPQVFAALGGPNCAYVVGTIAKTEDDDTVALEYKSFYLHLRIGGDKQNKTVHYVNFGPGMSSDRSPFAGSVHGFKMGDDRDGVLKLLGRPAFSSGFRVFKDNKGVETKEKQGVDSFYVSDEKVRLVVSYDKNGKVERIEAIKKP